MTVIVGKLSTVFVIRAISAVDGCAPLASHGRRTAMVFCLVAGVSRLQRVLDSYSYFRSFDGVQAS